MTSPVLQFKRGLFVNLPGLRAGEPGFTTDTYDLYVGLTSETSTNKFFGSQRYWGREDGTNSLRLNLVDKNGSNYVAIKSPNTLAGIVTYTLPGVQGANSTVLTNDGSGNLTWASGSANPVFTGIATFTDTTDNTLGDPNTGAVQIDGGLGVNKNVTVGAGLSVNGTSHFIGTCTFAGGTINLGDSNTDDIVVAGEFKSNLVPTDDGSYDLGIVGKRWRDIHTNGVATIGSLVCQDGGLFTGSVQINTNLNVNGNITVGGTTVTLRGQEVFIENKDIVLGYTTSVTNTDASTDDTANHAGVAIASTIGTPLVSFNATGINTLPDTYKQMMWFKSGTLGFATDAFAFNYGVAIGTTTMADGVRLAVGTGVTVSDTAVSATNFYGSLVGNASSANQVKTISASDTNATYYVTFVDANNGSATNETVYTDDGIYYNPGTNKLTTQHAEFTGNVLVSGIATVGTGVGITQFSGSVSTGNSTSSVPTSSAVVEYIRNADFGIAGDTGSGSVNMDHTFTISGTASEVETTVSGQTVTIGLPDAVVVGTSLSAPTLRTGTIQSSNTGATAITIAANDVTIADDLTVGGNLYVNGNTTQVNTSAITVEDRTIELGVVDGSAPSSSTTWDLGVLFNYYDGSAKKSAVVWEQGDQRFKLASVLGADSNGTNNSTPQLTVTTFAPIEVAELWVNNSCTGGAQQVIGCSSGELKLQNITVDAGLF